MTWQMYGNEKYDEGMENKAKETAIRMHAKRMGTDTIAEILEETEEQIRQWVFAIED